VWTQRDQIQAYQFLRRRLVSALVAADANHPTSPSRRLVLGTIIGVAAAVLTTAVFGIIGLLNPSGSTDWQQGGQVLVEQETGARYVYGKDGLLHPVLNYASARLLAGGDGTQTSSVSAKSLASASRGAMLGIIGAPDSLPTTDALLAHPVFASCTRMPADLPATAEPVSTVVLAGAVPAGQTLANGAGLLVALRSGGKYLVTDGRRYLLPGQGPVGALGYETQQAMPVAGDWLATVPVGRDLGLVDVPNAGSTGPSVGGASTRVGQVLGAGGDYLVRSDGLAPITPTEAALVLGDTNNASAYPDGRPRVLSVSVAAATSAPISKSTDDAGYPGALPVLANPSPTAVLCAVGDGQDTTRIMAEPALPLPDGGKPMPASGAADPRVAGEVYVPPTSGALVRELVGSGGTTPTTYLVTDAGTKYPVPSQDALKFLGYGGITPQPVAGTLLALLPTGPSLDPAVAGRVVPASAQGKGGTP
jgi:type VII secretion protein EccB